MLLWRHPIPGAVQRRVCAQTRSSYAHITANIWVILSSADIDEVDRTTPASMGIDRGHRTMAIVRKGGKHVTIPLAPRTGRSRRSHNWARSLDSKRPTHTQSARIFRGYTRRSSSDCHCDNRVLRPRCRRRYRGSFLRPRTQTGPSLGRSQSTDTVSKRGSDPVTIIATDGIVWTYGP
jgi:hypothetical protein